MTDNPAESRFESRDAERLAGFEAYVPTPEVVAFVHTELDLRRETRAILCGCGGYRQRAVLRRIGSVSPRTSARPVGLLAELKSS